MAVNLLSRERCPQLAKGSEFIEHIVQNAISNSHMYLWMVPCNVSRKTWGNVFVQRRGGRWRIRANQVRDRGLGCLQSELDGVSLSVPAVLPLRPEWGPKQPSPSRLVLPADHMRSTSGPGSTRARYVPSGSMWSSGLGSTRNDPSLMEPSPSSTPAPRFPTLSWGKRTVWWATHRA